MGVYLLGKRKGKEGEAFDCLQRDVGAYVIIVIYGVCGSFGFHLQVVISSYGADPHFFLMYLCRRLIAINPYWVRLVIAVIIGYAETVRRSAELQGTALISKLYASALSVFSKFRWARRVTKPGTVRFAGFSRGFTQNPQFSRGFQFIYVYVLSTDL